jgi:glycosyltransferase involved in cell wall biosynthesis
MISVIIPTYKEPEVLDLCLRSAIEGQNYKNEIIVVVDGFYEENKEVLTKWKDHISILNLEENVGQSRCTNLGVYNATYDLVLIVNDDNVFPKNWDIKLERSYEPNSVISPNQIEPIPSMFRQFIIKDLGRDPNTFDLQSYWNFEDLQKDRKIEETGSTLPILINKYDYLRVGGWDESYPGAWVVDWEFFMKCKMTGMKMLRSYDCSFYHFVSIGTKSQDRIAHSQMLEQQCHEYSYYKWRKRILHNPIDNSKYLS